MQKFFERLGSLLEPLAALLGTILFACVGLVLVVGLPAYALYQLLVAPMFTSDPLSDYLRIGKVALQLVGGLAALCLVLMAVGHLARRFAVVRQIGTGIFYLFVGAIVFGGLLRWCDPSLSDYCQESRYVVC